MFSLFLLEVIDCFLQQVSVCLCFVFNVEIILEINLGIVEYGCFDCYCVVGVNCFSFGIQSFDDVMFKCLGCIYDSGEVECVVKMVQDVGYDNVNIDLMYVFLEQILVGVEVDLECVFVL